MAHYSYRRDLIKEKYILHRKILLHASVEVEHKHKEHFRRTISTTVKCIVLCTTLNLQLVSPRIIVRVIVTKIFTISDTIFNYDAL